MEVAIRTRILGLALLALLGAVPVAGAAIPGEVKRETPFRGVTLVDVVRKTPRPLRIHVVLVDLRAEGVSVEVGHGRKLSRGRFATKRVRLMAQKSGYAVAVNGGPFDPPTVVENAPVLLEGPVRSRGITLVRGRDSRAALCILAGNRAAIRGSPLRGSGIREAVAGFDSPGCLVAGKAKGPNTRPEPRTAAGVSRDGRTLILVVVDGRQEGISEGMTILELGKLLREFGAHEGLNLDGGGGSILVVADEKNVPRARNVPVGLGITGTERAAGTCIGIRAERIPPDEPDRPEERPEATNPELPPLPPLPEPPGPSDPDALPPRDPGEIAPVVEPLPESPDEAKTGAKTGPAPEPSPAGETRRGVATWTILGAALALLALLLVLGKRGGKA